MMAVGDRTEAALFTRGFRRRLAALSPLRASDAAKARGLEHLHAEADRLRRLQVFGPGAPSGDGGRAGERGSRWSAHDWPALVAEDADTARLVQQYQAGQVVAFAAIYARYRERVHGHLLYLLGDAHDAEELTQDVFVRLREALPAYERRGSTPFRAFLFTITHRCGMTRLEQRVRLVLVAPLELNERRERTGEFSPGPRLDWIDDDELHQAFGRLPLDQQRVLTLRFLLGCSVAETANVLARSVTAVTSLQNRAHAALRRATEGSGERGSADERARVEIFMSGRARTSPVAISRRFALRA